MGESGRFVTQIWLLLLHHIILIGTGGARDMTMGVAAVGDSSNWLPFIIVLSHMSKGMFGEFPKMFRVPMSIQRI